MFVAPGTARIGCGCRSPARLTSRAVHPSRHCTTSYYTWFAANAQRRRARRARCLLDPGAPRQLRRDDVVAIIRWPELGRLVVAGSAVRDDDWTVPGVHEVTAGVYRIPLPLPNDGLRAVNVCAILAGAEVVLVDSGWAITEARARLEAGLKSLGVSLVEVGGFVVTHVRRDHYSQAVHVRREFGTAVSLGVVSGPRWIN
jgi:hypothetical protein